MRMRRKHNLDERLSCVGKHLIYVETSDFYDKSEIDKYFYPDFTTISGNQGPLWMDIGCGKGSFALEIARRNPGVNVLAVEKISNVILEGCEKARDEGIGNCFFLNCAADNLGYYIKPRSVDKIFLNFSCPFPKNTYENRRLTYRKFLGIYKVILKKDGDITLKTDDKDFFAYSLASFSQNGFAFKDISFDYHANRDANNIETEYEKIFSAKGIPICRAVAFPIG